jgi:uncharacterized NAD-dependent epimerase/dehydratase family protein
MEDSYLDLPGARAHCMCNVTMATSNGYLEGNAVVYCDGAFATGTGKTAHGLVRKTLRYNVVAVIDAALRGRDAAEFLDGEPKGIPLVADLAEARAVALRQDRPLTHFVIGLAPDGGRLRPQDRACVKQAIELGLNVDSGLHDFMSEDAEFAPLAARHGVTLRDIRKPPARGDLHFFAGKINEVRSLRIAVLGTDAAVGKRTTCWHIVDGLSKAGHPTELVGTGQTAWLQGARYGIRLDALVNDFIAGELEHAVWSAWSERRPHAIVIEGQGSLLNPAYPGGLEILAASRPHLIVVQHAPTRREYDGFPGFAMHDLPFQIKALEMLSAKPVVAVTLNHEGIAPVDIPRVCAELREQVRLPVVDVLTQGASELMRTIQPWIAKVWPEAAR